MSTTIPDQTGEPLDRYIYHNQAGGSRDEQLDGLPSKLIIGFSKNEHPNLTVVAITKLVKDNVSSEACPVQLSTAVDNVTGKAITLECYRSETTSATTT
ncbi:hypothetical protein BGZ73_008188, partial [Actinomortierella ambigua]